MPANAAYAYSLLDRAMNRARRYGSVDVMYVRNPVPISNPNCKEAKVKGLSKIDLGTCRAGCGSGILRTLWSRRVATPAATLIMLTRDQSGNALAIPPTSQARVAVSVPPKIKPRANNVTAFELPLLPRPTGGVNDPALLMLQVDPESEYPVMAPIRSHA